MANRPLGTGKGANTSLPKAQPFDPTTGTGPSNMTSVPPFDQHAQQNPQQPMNNIELNQAQIPAGGRILKKDPGPASAETVGTGTRGKSKSGFTLRG